MAWERALTGDGPEPDDRSGSRGDASSTHDATLRDMERRSHRRFDFSADGYERMLDAFENGELAEADARTYFGRRYEDIREAADSTKRS